MKQCVGKQLKKQIIILKSAFIAKVRLSTYLKYLLFLRISLIGKKKTFAKDTYDERPLSKMHK